MSRGVVCTSLTGEDGLEIRELPASRWAQARSGSRSARRRSTTRTC